MAERPAAPIEVTQEMVEAGVYAFYSSRDWQRSPGSGLSLGCIGQWRQHESDTLENASDLV